MQLGFLEHRENGEVSGEFRVLRRYDCEESVLGSSFLTFFPTFAKQVQSLQQELGTLMEDSLQCVGRIDGAYRQFPTKDEYVTNSCPTSVDDILARRSEDPSKTQERTAFLERKMTETLGVLRGWLEQLSDMADALVADFQKNWAHGEKLTGRAFTEQNMNAVREIIGIPSAVKQRYKILENHLVQKAWQSRGQRDLSLFPPPLQYDEALEIGIHTAYESGARDICRVDSGLSIKYRAVHHGWTHRPLAGGPAKTCMAGSFMPLGRVEISILGCSRALVVDGEEQDETSWEIGLTSILSTEEGSSLAKGSLNSAFVGRTDDLDTGLMQRDKITSSVAWKLAQGILMDPLSFYSGNLAAKDEVLRASVETVGRQLGEAATSTAVEVAADESPVPRIFESTSIRILDIRLNLVKIGQGAYQPTFNVFYTHMNSTSMPITFPGALKLDTHVGLTQKYDLSEVFSSIYYSLQDNKLEKAYGECIHCLERPRRVFCFNQKTQSSACTAAKEEACGLDLAIQDATDCWQARFSDEL